MLFSGVRTAKVMVRAGIAQLVEHNLAKVGVAGSSPVSRSPEENVAGWSSLVARRAHNPEVVGSNPTPAIGRNGGTAEFPPYRRSLSGG